MIGLCKTGCCSLGCLTSSAVCSWPQIFAITHTCSFLTTQKQAATRLQVHSSPPTHLLDLLVSPTAFVCFLSPFFTAGEPAVPPGTHPPPSAPCWPSYLYRIMPDRSFSFPSNFRCSTSARYPFPAFSLLFFVPFIILSISIFSCFNPQITSPIFHICTVHLSIDAPPPPGIHISIFIYLYIYIFIYLSFLS